MGDKTAASRRIEAFAGLEILPLDDEVIGLSETLIQDGGVPKKALDDALHIAISAVHCVDFLLTWNCRHIDNAEMKPGIREICLEHGFQCPEIATPIELMGLN
jgi:hypothetical protein